MEAARLIGRRFVQLAVVLLLVSFFTFSLVRLLPGDPTQTIIPFGTDQQRAQLAKDLGAQFKSAQSNAATDYAPNLQAMASENCNLIFAVGFNLSADTVTAALANPTIHYALIDDAADNNNDGKTDAPNIKPILYDTGEALDDYAIDPVLRNDRSFIILADLEDARVRALRLVPILLRGTQVGLARGRDFEETCRRMQMLSAEMGTRARPGPHGLTIGIPAAGV